MAYWDVCNDMTGMIVIVEIWEEKSETIYTQACKNASLSRKELSRGLAGGFRVFGVVTERAEPEFSYIKG